MDGKATLHVRLARSLFASGEVIEGSVVLQVGKPAQCSGTSSRFDSAAWLLGSVVTVLLLAVCRARAEGDGKGGNHLDGVRGRIGRSEQRDAQVPPARGGKEMVVVSLLHCLIGHLLQIVLCAEEREYPAGDHVFPFRFPLRGDLPGSFAVEDRVASPLEAIRANVEYSLKAVASINSGRFIEDLAGKAAFDVYRPYVGPPVEGLESSVTGKVGTLAVFSKGLCHVAASLDKNVFSTGETIAVQARITNQSPKDMDAVSLRLYEDLSVTLPNRKPRTGSTVLCRQEYRGVKAGQLLAEVLPLPLVASKTQQPINSTTTGAFISWDYRLVIKCKYSLSHSVRLEFPVFVERTASASTEGNVAEPVAEPSVSSAVASESS